MTRSTKNDGARFEIVAGPAGDGSQVDARSRVALAGWQCRSADQDSLSMGTGGLDPALVEIVDLVTRRIIEGESIDDDWLAVHYPERAHAIANLLPSIRELADIGRVKSGGGSRGGRVPIDPARQKVFGDFRIVRTIGRGGMGLVYEAEQITLGRKVALKLIPAAAALDPRALHRFQLEAQVAGWLQHPRIVPVYAFGTVDDIPYYAMQLIEGGSLADLITEMRGWEERTAGTSPPDENSVSDLTIGLLSGRFATRHRESDIDHAGPAPAAPDDRPARHWLLSIRSRHYIRTVVRLTLQAAEALAYAHDQGVIHRDVKPANLLLDRRGDLWVADFGMASVQGDAGLTTSGDLPGTLRYMSPEQALGRRAQVDRRTDVYALGATLYELLTLRPAFASLDRQEVFRRIVEDEPTPVGRLNPAVPVDLATIVAKAIAKDPAGRYDTAWLLAADLTRFLEGRPIAARPVGPVARTWRWCRRKPMLAGLAAALVFAVAGGFSGIMWNWRNAQASEKKALLHAAKADAINNFLIEKLLRQAAPENNPAAKRVTLIEVLDRAASEVGESFGGQAEVEAAIRLTIGQTYHDLGDYRKSATHYRSAYELYRRGSDQAVEPRLKAMAELGHSLVHIDQLEEAEPILLSVVGETGRLLGPTHDQFLKAIEYLASLRQRQGRNSDAEALYRQLVDDSRRARGPRHPETLTAINNLGTVLEKEKQYEEAERLFRECLALSREIKGQRHPDTIGTMYNVGFVLGDLRRYGEAEFLIRETLEARRQILGEEHPQTLQSLSKLGSLLRDQGRLDAAAPLLRSSLEAQRRILGPTHADTIRTSKSLDALLNHSARLVGVKAP